MCGIVRCASRRVSAAMAYGPNGGIALISAHGVSGGGFTVYIA
jgi:hypothetical protein